MHLSGDLGGKMENGDIDVVILYLRIHIVLLQMIIPDKCASCVHIKKQKRKQIRDIYLMSQLLYDAQMHSCPRVSGIYW